ncbi:MAG TPA: tetratricopeptide repeat protein [Solirubrobacteraceae bacterium]|nr:tetratricopeptide repeat protein [Solirubrobacteraceae bacterium]
MVRGRLQLRDVRQRGRAVRRAARLHQGAPPVVSGAGARADALVELGRHEQAADVLREAIAADPERADLHCRLAFALERAGRHAEALAAAERAARQAPDWEWPHRLRAVALAGLGKAKRAVGAAEEAVRLAPEEAAAHEVLADSRLAAGDHRGARAAAERSRELDPSAAGPHHTLGDVALAQDRFGEAEEHYRRALELDPTNQGTLNNLGIAMLRWGREEQARALFERAAQADPADPVARTNLARTSRNHVNGVAVMTACAFAAWLLLKAVVAGALVPAAVLAGVLAAGVAVFVLRSRRRASRLSPATQMLLGDQPWWERIELTSWRPWWWFIPSPIWLLIAIGSFTGGMIEAFEAGWDATSIGVQLVLLAAIVVFARYSRLWLRRRGWISF